MSVSRRTLGLALASTALTAAAPRTSSDDDFIRRADATVARSSAADDFSGAVLIARRGRPLFRKAYGFADREWGLANTLDTKFRIGSMTKAFTAAAILQLQERGALSTTDTVAKHYDRAPASWLPITIQQLLTHESGLPDYTELPNFESQLARLDRSIEQTLGLVAGQPLDFTPGQRFGYSNTGYMLLGLIVERTAGQSYTDYVQQRILRPAGMSNSGHDSTDRIIPRHATGYDRELQGWVNARYWSYERDYADGGLYSTVEDLSRWDQALYGDRLLSAASRQAMFKDYGHGYGFGWYIDPKFGRLRQMHGGGVNGFHSFIARYPQDQTTVIALANNTYTEPMTAADNLAALAFGVGERAPSPKGLETARRLVAAISKGAGDCSGVDLKAINLNGDFRRLRCTVASLGPLQSIKLMSVEPSGVERYLARFDRGAVEVSFEWNAEGEQINGRMRRAVASS